MKKRRLFAVATILVVCAAAVVGFFWMRKVETLEDAAKAIIANLFDRRRPDLLFKYIRSDEIEISRLSRGEFENFYYSYVVPKAGSLKLKGPPQMERFNSQGILHVTLIATSSQGNDVPLSFNVIESEEGPKLTGAIWTLFMLGALADLNGAPVPSGQSKPIWWIRELDGNRELIQHTGIRGFARPQGVGSQLKFLTWQDFRKECEDVVLKLQNQKKSMSQPK